MSKPADISVSILESLTLLRELSQEALQQLAKEAEFEDVPAQATVFRQGDHDEWTRYLLSGSLALHESDGSERTLVGLGNIGIADEPLGFAQPHSMTAIARTSCRLLRFPAARLQESLASTRLPEIGVAVMDGQQEEASDRLFLQLVQDLMEEKLELPSMPDIALRVREAIASPDASGAEIARIIQADPVVAVQVIKAANSSLFSGSRPTDNLTAAIARLGFGRTREVVMAITMKQVFRSESPLLNKRMVELWMRSTLVAAIAAVLARKITGFSSDRAMLAGLVHDIGVVPMLANAFEYNELIRDPGLLEATIEEYGGQVGGMILRRWNFPDDMIRVALDGKQWERGHDGAADYVDLIIVAQLHAAGGMGGLPAPTEVPAFRKLGLAPLGDDGRSILDEAREEVAEVQQVLLG
jgi:HD-like signal output (HDOD) protein